VYLYIYKCNQIYNISERWLRLDWRIYNSDVIFLAIHANWRLNCPDEGGVLRDVRSTSKSNKVPTATYTDRRSKHQNPGIRNRDKVIGRFSETIINVVEIGLLVYASSLKYILQA